jgi:hypothetical protein
LGHQRPLRSVPQLRAPIEERRKDYERRAMVDVALILAELDASWGDYNHALKFLESADELTRGSIAPRWAARRRRWLDATRGFSP